MLIAPFTRNRAQNARSAWARYRQIAEERRNSLGMDLLLIPPGQFAMGSYETPDDLKRAFPETQIAIYIRERPVHPVTITRPFFLGRYEVTKGQFKKFVDATNYKTSAEQDGKGGWGYSGDARKPLQHRPNFNWRNWGVDQKDESPVVNISWIDASRFCGWLSHKEGKRYHLPTEAEWEYACRAGTTTRYYNGNDPEALTRIANVRDAALKRQIPGWTHCLHSSDGWPFTSPIGQFEPNNFGLYDMLGNACEWCSDRFDENYYADSPQTDPAGPTAGTKRVARGEGWHSKPVDCRPARRLDYVPSHRDATTGFRVVCEP
jgi:formylglycine-generating enzyme required for sulfatase activity